MSDNKKAMGHQQDHPSKSILRPEHDHQVCLGTYNLHAKRASFKADVLLQQVLENSTDQPSDGEVVLEKHVPIAPDDTEVELTEAELQKREEFKAKRRVLALEGADGKDLKAILAHGVCCTGETFEEDDACAYNAVKH